jgi:transcription elongation factor Elf1
MSTFEVTVPEDVRAPIEVTCTAHGTSETFDRSHKTVTLACEDCGLELETTVYDLGDWRDLTERC